MKTLQECKDEVANKQGFKDYNETYYTERRDWSISRISDEAAELYAQQFKDEVEELKRQYTEKDIILDKKITEINHLKEEILKVADYNSKRYAEYIAEINRLKEENERLKKENQGFYD